MNRKLVPEIRVRAYLQKAIAIQDQLGAAVADEFGQMMQRDSGDGAAVTQDAGKKAETWTARNGLVIDDNLRLIKFDKDKLKQGTTAIAVSQGSGLVGFCLNGREYPFNCVMEKPSSAGLPPEGDAQHETLVFKAVRGKVDAAKRSRWDTVLPDSAVRATRIFHAQQVPNELLICRTMDTLPKDMSFRLDLTNLQVAIGHKGPARARWEWGGGAYALVFRQGDYVTIERRSRGGKAGSGGKNWESWRQLTELPRLEFKTDIVVRVEQIGGRMTLDVNGETANLIEMSLPHGAKVENEQEQGEPVPISWPAGKCTLYLAGLSATLGLAEIRYASVEDKEIADTGSIRKKRKLSGLWLPFVEGEATAQAWRPAGTKVEAEIHGFEDKLDYEVKLHADPDGRYTPIVMGVMGYIPNDVRSLNATPLDITPAVVDWDITLAEPGIATGTDLQLTLDRDVLPLLPLPEDAPFGASWRDYLDALQYNPIDFAVRWHRENGEVDKWVGLFSGYAWDVTKNAPDVNEQGMSVRCRDKSARFKEPAGILDETIPALGYLCDGKKSIFAADLIQEIIRRILGPVEANRMNGSGNARRFLPPGHWPLISPESDTVGVYGLSKKLPFTGGLLFKPPYLRDAASWISDLAKDDAGGEDLACFFYGYADDSGQVEEQNGDGEGATISWPVPIYGFLSEIIANRFRWTIGDTVYAQLQHDVVLSGASAQSRPEKDYNTVLIVNTPQGVSKETLPGPGLTVARARVPASDPQAPERSWMRTQVRDLSLVFVDSEQAQAMANLAVDITSGARAIQASLELTKGEALMQWGDLVQPWMTTVLGQDEDGNSSDPSLGLNGRWFRCLRVRHFGNQRDREFRTAITAHTLSDLEVENQIGGE